MTNLKIDTSKKQDIFILIVTGLSGAGKTSVMRALEDLGFFCIDNLPVPLLSSFLTIAFNTQTNLSKIALGIDARGEQFLNEFTDEIKRLKEIEELKNIKIVFLNASEKTILKRFQETRRNHPLAQNIDIASAIKKERTLLEPIKAMSDMILDTDIFNIHELRTWVRNAFDGDRSHKLFVNLVSFGFKHGMAPESNLLYDVRFLPNPYFIPELKHFDGTTEIIQNYLFAQPAVTDFWNQLSPFFGYILQKFYEEGRFFVTIAIGCTGGKHRSVALIEKISKEKFKNVTFLINHRDLEKE